MTQPSEPGDPRGRLAEEVRLRYLYRSLILRGRLRLSRAAAVSLIGPDCAYHLYRLEGIGEGSRGAVPTTGGGCAAGEQGRKL